MVPSGGPKRSFLPTSSSLLAYTQSLTKRMISYQKMKTYRLGDIEIQGVPGGGGARILFLTPSLKEQKGRNMRGWAKRWLCLLLPRR